MVYGRAPPNPTYRSATTFSNGPSNLGSPSSTPRIATATLARLEVPNLQYHDIRIHPLEDTD
ncbi:hypothetical protein PtA15_16A86 [Puccinia triticina]|uniref:Uncharacterized protein n=1 Tax=Puccinia triticina TaxID=208348 RepID=A0ABY7D837_9BASI|nr:uncharacterized protein PtA15_16A86 [Puccinia triticina]WAQ92180.1 hypothetical protein PtA15_16A86 [Puccinia triticina]WAR63924.1 hypothetical protein PtB15_16B83 [Puccinia triticina]